MVSAKTVEQSGRMIHLFIKYTFISSIVEIVFLLILCAIMLIIKDSQSYFYLLKLINIIFDDVVTAGVFIGLIFSYFINLIYIYRYSKDAIVISEKIISSKISKEELANLLFIHNNFKIIFSSPEFINLSLKFKHYEHNIIIWDHKGELKLSASQYVFDLINPLLAKYSKV